jgi:hypothetical protein
MDYDADARKPSGNGRRIVETKYAGFAAKLAGK